MEVESKPHHGFQVVGLTSLAMLASGALGYGFPGGGAGNPAWRPEAGVLAALVLLFDPRWSVWVLLTALPCQILIHSFRVPAFGWGSLLLVSALQVAAAAMGMRCFRRLTFPPVAFTRLRELYCLFVFLGLFMSASTGLVETLLQASSLTVPGFFRAWLGVWIRDSLGYLLLMPLVITCWHGAKAPKRWASVKVFEGAGVFCFTVASAAFAFQAAARDSLGHSPFAYLPFPALVWAALRFGPRGAAVTSFVLALLALLHPPGASATASLSLAARAAENSWIQLYLLVSSGMALLLAVAIRERETTAAALEESQKRSRALAENLRQTEHDVQKTEDLYRRAIMAANAVPYMRDYRSSRFLFMGEGIRELTGYKAAEMTPDIWESLTLEHLMLGETHGLTYEEAIRRTRAGEFKHWQSDVLIATRTGEQRWISDASVEVADKEGRPIGSVGILIDVTDRKRAEDAMRRANAGLEGRIAERTAELEIAIRDLEAFTYSVSHDLRAPLRAIEGFSRILEEDHQQEMSPEAASLLARVRVAAVKMDLLISNLLSFSRLNRQTMSRKTIDLNALVKDAFQQLRLEQENRIVRIEHHDLPPGVGDPDLLRQVMTNLISNALKYTRKRPVAEIQIGFRLSDQGETIYFVQDNGTGFDMAYSDKLFGVFQRLHHSEDYEGMGVGLAVAQRIIRRHGGRMWALSEVDKGASFFFTLGTPQTPIAGSSRAADPKSTSDVAGRPA